MHECHTDAFSAHKSYEESAFAIILNIQGSLLYPATLWSEFHEPSMKNSFDTVVWIRTRRRRYSGERTNERRGSPPYLLGSTPAPRGNPSQELWAMDYPCINITVWPLREKKKSWFLVSMSALTFVWVTIASCTTSARACLFDHLEQTMDEGCTYAFHPFWRNQNGLHIRKWLDIYLGGTV